MIIEELKRFLAKTREENIIFKNHFYESTANRPVDEAMIKKYLKKEIVAIEEQPSKNKGENKYKLWIKLSRKYCLVVIVAIDGISLNIITAWNKKWKK